MQPAKSLNNDDVSRIIKLSESRSIVTFTEKKATDGKAAKVSYLRTNVAALEPTGPAVATDKPNCVLNTADGKYSSVSAGKLTNYGLKFRPGWVRWTGDIPVYSGPMDPALSAYAENGKSNSHKLTVTVASAGKLGEFLAAVNKEFLACVTDSDFADGSLITSFLRTHYTKKATDKQKRGLPLEEPLINFSIVFGNFPTNHPDKSLAGTPRFTVSDYSTREVREVRRGGKRFNQVLYSPLLAEVGGVKVPITADNVHLALDSRCVIKDIRFVLCDVSAAGSFVSMRADIHKLIVEVPEFSALDAEDMEEVEGDGETAAESSEGSSTDNESSAGSPTLIAGEDPADLVNGELPIEEADQSIDDLLNDLDS